MLTVKFINNLSSLFERIVGFLNAYLFWKKGRLDISFPVIYNAVRIKSERLIILVRLRRTVFLALT